jgi:hypothetical protein
MTVFTLSVDGSTTPTGAAVQQAQKPLDGSTTPTGAAAQQAQKPLGGSETPAGALVDKAVTNLAGSETPAGGLVDKAVTNLAGLTTPAGVLSSLVSQHLAGSVTPTGVLALFGHRNSSAATTRLRASTITARRLASLAATALRSRSGSTFSQTINPAISGAMGVRWRFDDLVTGASYVFDVNPLSGGSATAKRTITTTPTTAADGDPVTFEGDSEMPTGEFAGTVNTQAQYAAFLTWQAARRPVQLTDDLLRRSIILILRVSPKRKYTRQHPSRREVTVSYRILQQTDV